MDKEIGSLNPTSSVIVFLTIIIIIILLSFFFFTIFSILNVMIESATIYLSLLRFFYRCFPIYFRRDVTCQSTVYFSSIYTLKLSICWHQLLFTASCMYDPARGALFHENNLMWKFFRFEMFSFHKFVEYTCT